MNTSRPVMIALLALAFAEPPKGTGSREATYLTGPIKADGTVDYLAWANAPLNEIKREDNAAVWLARVVGPKAADKEVRARYFQLLGIDPPLDEGVYLLGLFQMEGYPTHPEEQD